MQIIHNSYIFKRFQSKRSKRFKIALFIRFRGTQPIRDKNCHGKLNFFVFHSRIKTGMESQHGELPARKLPQEIEYDNYMYYLRRIMNYYCYEQTRLRIVTMREISLRYLWISGVYSVVT